MAVRESKHPRSAVIPRKGYNYDYDDETFSILEKGCKQRQKGYTGFFCTCRIDCRPSNDDPQRRNNRRPTIERHTARDDRMKEKEY